MMTAEDYGRIRRAHRDQMSIREIARTFGHARVLIGQAEKRNPNVDANRVRELAIELAQKARWVTHVEISSVGAATAERRRGRL